MNHTKMDSGAQFKIANKGTRVIVLVVFVLTLLFFFVNINCAFAQTKGIISGAIYAIKSKSSGKLLEVSNASMKNGANIDCWTDTKSDAQRWIVRHVRKNVYTLTNVASGKLLHIGSGSDALANVDQYANTGNNQVKWILKRAGNGYYYLKSATNENPLLSVHAGAITDGTNINLSNTSDNSEQKWLFEKEGPQNIPPRTAIADKVFKSWYTQYNIEIAKGFWDKAEMMEIVLDAYEVTKEAKYITIFDKMYKNFLASNKSDWMYDRYNDDITWAVLFCVRGYLLTGNKIYLKQGKEQFDKMYARAYSSSFGGGLIWYETKTSKNACINGPAMVACCYLARATGDKTYYDKAITLYNWSKVYLFNPTSGKVNDNVDFDRSGDIKISSWSSTYNQGTYLGAAVMLYNYTKDAHYLADAENIATYTRDSMYNSKVINNENGGNDLPGFKGIFVRYARMYAVKDNRSDLNSWLELNARTAYNNRNSHNLIQTKWGTRTNEIKPRSAFGSSTAVSLLMNTLFLKH
ncbi:glycoside hydrolase family 76 protein [Arachidicoccus sp.]|uniref:glycoside hydrolase family 76 protein n=1 Tax=Arachidicoccus sp. TaxID=1872624 RepID=UPI003D1E1C24